MPAYIRNMFTLDCQLGQGCSLLFIKSSSILSLISVEVLNFGSSLPVPLLVRSRFLCNTIEKTWKLLSRWLLSITLKYKMKYVLISNIMSSTWYRVRTYQRYGLDFKYPRSINGYTMMFLLCNPWTKCPFRRPLTLEFIFTYSPIALYSNATCFPEDCMRMTELYCFHPMQQP